MRRIMLAVPASRWRLPRRLGCFRHDLEQDGWSHRDIAAERPAVRRDQDDGHRDSCREHRHDDAVGGAIVTVNQADNEQREPGLGENGWPKHVGKMAGWSWRERE